MSSGWSDFGGINEGYALELYERFLKDPASVDPATRELFQRNGSPARPDGPDGPVGPEGPGVSAIVGAVTLAESIRRYGHLAAKIDPLGSTPLGDPSLTPETHGVNEIALESLPASLVGGPLAEGARHAGEAIERLRAVYCSSIGFDISHIFVPEEREWLRFHIEAGTFRPPHQPVEAVDLLERITEVETFERFLHKAFVGKTRFSIEGLDMMVPVLDEIIADSAVAGVKQVLIGMAHRGRLNVLDARDAQELRADPRRVQGSDGQPAVPRGPRLDGRREVPRRRPRAGARRVGAGSAHLDAAEPEPPRVREPGRRRHGARRVHRRLRARAPPSSTRASRCRS